MNALVQLSPNFSLLELTRSTRATELGIDNSVPQEFVPRLVAVADMLERIRSTLGAPITVTSGYRCLQLNRAVGGVATSDHTQARAADFVCPGYGRPEAIARTLAPMVSVLGIGQLILEGVKGKQWVHVSTVTPQVPANRVITITDKGTQLGIQAIG